MDLLLILVLNRYEQDILSISLNRSISVDVSQWSLGQIALTNKEVESFFQTVVASVLTKIDVSLFLRGGPDALYKSMAAKRIAAI